MRTSEGKAPGGEVDLVDGAHEEPTEENPDVSPEDRPLETGEPLADDEFLRAIVALVFASPEPITERKLAALLAGERGNPQVARVVAALETMKVRLKESGLPLDLRSIAGGWQILTTPDTSEVVKRLFQDRKAERISPAALETLAIVAYRQPVTKSEIEAIRGVQVGPILRTLVDRGLARVAGRADVPGHPLQYETTKAFLDRFGLSGLDDLPRDSELAR
jgi:segregation and condensation protein B